MKTLITVFAISIGVSAFAAEEKKDSKERKPAQFLTRCDKKIYDIGNTLSDLQGTKIEGHGPTYRIQNVKYLNEIGELRGTYSYGVTVDQNCVVTKIEIKQ